MNILSIEEHELGGITVVYREGSIDVPYHLNDDMKGPFAVSVRKAVEASNLTVKSLKEVISERTVRQEQSEEIRNAFNERRKLEKEQKNKALAEAIISGRQDAILEALSR